MPTTTGCDASVVGSLAATLAEKAHASTSAIPTQDASDVAVLR
jgi:hypothetical protein